MNNSKSHPTSRASRAYIHCAARGRTLAYYVLALGTLGVISPTQAVTPTCGQVITGNAVLTGSLTCDDSTFPSPDDTRTCQCGGARLYADV